MKNPLLQFIVCLVLAVFLAYSNVYGNVFLFDDDLLITLNELLRSWSTFGHLLIASTMEGAHAGGGFYRPVQKILYFLICQIPGNDPLSFPLLIVALHAPKPCSVSFLGCVLRFVPKLA